MSALLGALLLVGSAALVRSAEWLDEPVKLVRTLQLLQDQIAHGTLESDGARRTLIDAIGTRLLAASPDTWSHARNVDAALLYVLSGGTPAVLERLPRGGEDDGRGQLINAVRAYVTGSVEEAKELWAPIDPGALPIGLVGPAALAKATLLTADDPQQAMKFVNLARLESPGTLIEEAAVRRGIEIAAKLGNAERFEFFAIRYASRFPRSMYAEVFRRRFSQFYLTIASQPAGKTPPTLETILAPLADVDRREIFLEIARLAIVGGKIALGKSAAEHAAALSGQGTIEMRRAQLYRAAALSVGDDPVAAHVELEAVRGGELPPEDRALLGAALAMVEEIQRLPESVGDEEPPPAEEAEATEGAPPAAASDVVTRAQDALVAAKRLLSEAGS